MTHDLITKYLYEILVQWFVILHYILLVPTDHTSVNIYLVYLIT